MMSWRCSEGVVARKSVTTSLIARNPDLTRTSRSWFSDFWASVFFSGDLSVGDEGSSPVTESCRFSLTDSFKADSLFEIYSWLNSNAKLQRNALQTMPWSLRASQDACIISRSTGHALVSFSPRDSRTSSTHCICLVLTSIFGIVDISENAASTISCRRWLLKIESSAKAEMIRWLMPSAPVFRKCMFVCWHTSSKWPVTSRQITSRRFKLVMLTWTKFATANKLGSRVALPYAWSIVSVLSSQMAFTRWWRATSSNFEEFSKTSANFFEIFGISWIIAVVRTVDWPFSCTFAVISPVIEHWKPRIQERCWRAERTRLQDWPSRGP